MSRNCYLCGIDIEPGQLERRAVPVGSRSAAGIATGGFTIFGAGAATEHRLVPLCRSCAEEVDIETDRAGAASRGRFRAIVGSILGFLVLCLAIGITSARRHHAEQQPGRLESPAAPEDRGEPPNVERPAQDAEPIRFDDPVEIVPKQDRPRGGSPARLAGKWLTEWTEPAGNAAATAWTITADGKLTAQRTRNGQAVSSFQFVWTLNGNALTLRGGIGKSYAFRVEFIDDGRLSVSPASGVPLSPGQPNPMIFRKVE